MQTRTVVGIVVVTVLAVAVVATVIFRRDPVVVLRIPEGARMPQAVADGSGLVHLLYFEGVMNGGNLLYVNRRAGASQWSTPRRVNSKPRSVVGVGPIDGGQVAMESTDGQLHVVWFQTDPVRLFYTRSTDNQTGFEPQRVLVELGTQLFEAAPTVTADSENRVFVFWHGTGMRDADDAHRAVYMTTSTDGGETFDLPRMVSPPAEGACGCCGIRALAHADGSLVVSYRGAGDNIYRGQRLLTSHDSGRTWNDFLLEPWEIGACPVTTTSLASGPDAPWVAWETLGQVQFASTSAPELVVAPEGSAQHRRKNPVIAVNTRGETLLAWGDGPGFRAGGTLHWQLFDADGQAARHQGPGTDSVPSGSTPAVLAQRDGTFVLLY